MKLFRQILALVLVAAVFVVFDLGFYTLLTRRCVPNYSGANTSIRFEDYLPFDPDSKIPHVDSSLHLTENLPVLDGATALLPVYSGLAAAVYPPDSCPVEGGNFAPESAVQYRNTVGAYQAVVDGTSDLIFCAQPSKEQLAYAEERGVELVLTPIGQDAFVFLVNSENPVESLTCEQVRGIYTGTYRNWKELGGPDRPILPLQRAPGSGSQTGMEAFMGDTPFARSHYRLDGAAIGYSYRWYVTGIVGNEKVKMLALDGVYPDTESIRSGAYPVAGPFYAVCRAGNPNENIPRILEWLLSDEGQRLIEESGYVPIR